MQGLELLEASMLELKLLEASMLRLMLALGIYHAGIDAMLQGSCGGRMGTVRYYFYVLSKEVRMLVEPNQPNNKAARFRDLYTPNNLSQLPHHRRRIAQSYSLFHSCCCVPLQTTTPSHRTAR